ncbi:uncharacterized protein LOC106640372 [Copidosoma floridanum]|uniref:uncharacterized protein LOC106640372 n=1 Tax=Copidosoma floridanum TaxID=29053 RepID=UPI0006C9CD6B|nr:uncharacterized protein LOC106640372 [Copidosoma floridanum]
MADSKILRFWAEATAAWVAQVEIILDTNGTTDDSQWYIALVSALLGHVVSELSDIIANPPATGQFKAIKDAILSRFQDSADAQIRKLFGQLQLTDFKPSQLLRQMKSLAAGKVNGILRIMKTAFLDELSSMADELIAFLPNVNAVATPTAPVQPANSSLAQEVTELRHALEEELTRQPTTLQTKTGAGSTSGLGQPQRSAVHRAPLVWSSGKRLINPTTKLLSLGSLAPASVHSVSVVTTLAQAPPGDLGCRFSDLLAEYAEVCSPEATMAALSDLPVHHTTTTNCHWTGESLETTGV